MTADATFVEMIGRNLSYFERLVHADDEPSQSELVDNFQGLYRSIEFGARTTASNYRASQLFVSSWSHIEHRGDYDNWAQLAIRLANRYEDADAFLLCRVVTLLGVLQQAQGDSVKAEKTFRSAERLSLAKEDTRAVANAWYYLATYYFKRRAVSDAVRYLLQALPLLESELDSANDNVRRLHGFVLNLLGACRESEGDIAKAERLLKRSELILRPLTEGHYHLIPRANLSTLYLENNQFELGLETIKQIIDYSSQHKLLIWQTTSLLGVAHALSLRNEHELALSYLQQVNHVELLRMRHLTFVARVKQRLGWLMINLSRHDEAEPFLMEAIDLHAKNSSEVNKVVCEGLLGLVRCHLSKSEAAKSEVTRALMFLDDLDTAEDEMHDYKRALEMVL